MEYQSMEQLDEKLIAVIGSSPRPRGGSSPILSLEERIAINVLWRKRVPVHTLMEVFQVSKNTIYGNALTGGGAYPAGQRAIEVNNLVDRMGVKQAEAKYVTPDIIRAVNRANRKLLASQSAA
jgi:hypothetical protein